MEENENKGVIASITERGFGFIKVEGRKSNVFFHAKDLVEGVRFDELRVGDELFFGSIEKTDRGEAAREVYLGA